MQGLERHGLLNTTTFVALVVLKIGCSQFVPEKLNAQTQV